MDYYLLSTKLSLPKYIWECLEIHLKGTCNTFKKGVKLHCYRYAAMYLEGCP